MTKRQGRQQGKESMGMRMSIDIKEKRLTISYRSSLRTQYIGREGPTDEIIKYFQRGFTKFIQKGSYSHDYFCVYSYSKLTKISTDINNYIQCIFIIKRK